MISGVPFLIINIFALSCFFLLFVALIVTKKSPSIWAFIAILADCILWSGGSVLMRLQMWPSVNFWYYVSLSALFIMEFLFYFFVHTFYKRKGKFILLMTFIGTVAIIPGTVTGFFLPPPVPTDLENGTTVFIYSDVNWHIAIPCVLFVAIIGLTAFLFLQLVREHGVHSPGLMVIFWCGVVMLFGNLLQIGIPGNAFPYDALAGIVFAIMLTFALYKRRMFQLTLLISRSILIVVLASICIVMAVFIVNPLQEFAISHLRFTQSYSTIFAAIIFSAVFAVSYILLRRIIFSVFSRDEQQGKQIKQFSNDVSQSLNTGEIMDMLSKAVMSEISADKVYVCQKSGDEFVAKCCSDPLELTGFSIFETSPQISFLKEQDGYLITKEFESSPLYLSVWEDEKELFHRLNIGCVVAIKDGSDIVGLLLLCTKDKDRHLNYTELTYLETVCSVASIAMKNAGLYEKMFQEARIDALTGIYNYRYFVEKETELFKECKDDCLSLIFADVDDFKLYNQLYGASAGDDSLCQIGRAIQFCAGNHGEVFRTSGKVFAVLLPHTDTRKAKALAEEICRRIHEINRTPDRRKYKELSVSVGICSAPYAASSAKELIDNADFAAYTAKQSGKDIISVFQEVGAEPQGLSDKTDFIVDKVDKGDDEFRGALDMISALTAAIDAKDHYTFNHSKNVARYAATLAVSLGLSEEQVRMIYAAGLLHDIGKISIPEDILRKTDKLSDSEYGVMKNHVNNSIEMIRHLPEMDYLIPAVLGHHERWDGRGYPRGITGDELPISARCLSVADAFDAMTTDRPYRKGLPTEYAVKQIREGAGTQFDPDLAVIFANLIEHHDILINTK